MDSSFDKDAFPLHPVRLEEMDGFLFVSSASTPKNEQLPLKESLGNVSKLVLDKWSLADMVTVGRAEYDVKVSLAKAGLVAREPGSFDSLSMFNKFMEFNFHVTSQSATGSFCLKILARHTTPPTCTRPLSAQWIPLQPLKFCAQTT